MGEPTTSMSGEYVHDHARTLAETAREVIYGIWEKPRS
jgi:hypothetical protein